MLKRILQHTALLGAISTASGCKNYPCPTEVRVETPDYAAQGQFDEDGELVGFRRFSGNDIMIRSIQNPDVAGGEVSAIHDKTVRDVQIVWSAPLSQVGVNLKLGEPIEGIDCETILSGETNVETTLQMNDSGSTPEIPTGEIWFCPLRGNLVSHTIGGFTVGQEICTSNSLNGLVGTNSFYLEEEQANRVALFMSQSLAQILGFESLENGDGLMSRSINSSDPNAYSYFPSSEEKDALHCLYYNSNEPSPSGFNFQEECVDPLLR